MSVLLSAAVATALLVRGCNDATSPTTEATTAPKVDAATPPVASAPRHPPRRAETSTSTEGPATPEPADERRRTLDVVVLRPEGAAAVGIEVRLLARKSGEFLDGSWLPEQLAAADAAGRVRFGLEGDGAILRWAFAWDGDACALEKLESADERRDVTLRLAPGIAANGHVEAAEGGPVAAAEVTLNVSHPLFSVEEQIAGPRLVVRTDAQGAFRFPSLPASELQQGSAWLTVRAPRRAPAGVDLPWRKPGDPVTIRLVAAVSIRGRCIDERGAPVEGVNVEVGPFAETRSGTDGRFELPGLPVSGGNLVAFKYPFAPVRRLALDGARGDVELEDLVLRAGGSVRGVVVDGEGRPLKDVHVALSRGGICLWEYADTDAAGRFAIGHVGEGEHVLAAQVPPGSVVFAADATSVESVVAGGQELRVVLRGARLLRFRFVDAATGAAIEVRDPKATVNWNDDGAAPLTASVSWDPDYFNGPLDAGRVLLPAAGRYDVVVTAPGYSKARVERVEVCDDREVVIDVPLSRGP